MWGLSNAMSKATLPCGNPLPYLRSEFIVMSLIYGKVLSLDAWAYIPVHMSTLTYHTTPTCNTHQIYTHTKIHTQTQELLEWEWEQIKYIKLNASERQVAKLCLDYQDTETARIQFKNEAHTYIISLRAHCVIINCFMHTWMYTLQSVTISWYEKCLGLRWLGPALLLPVYGRRCHGRLYLPFPSLTGKPPGNSPWGKL